MEYVHEHHSIHLIVYHFVWRPKRRRKLLVGPIHDRLKAIMEQVAEEHDWQILRLAIQPDHVHLFIRANPYSLPSDIPRLMKGAQLARFARGVSTPEANAVPLDPFFFCQDSGQGQPGNHPKVH